MALGDIGIRMQRVARDIERGYAQAGVVDGGLPLAQPSGVGKQLGRIAVRGSRITTDPDLEVVHQTGPRGPIRHLLEAAVGHCIRQQANSDGGIGAFQIVAQRMASGAILSTLSSRTRPPYAAR